MTDSTLHRLAPEFQLLCLAARRTRRPEDRAALGAVITAAPDWSVVVDIVRRHRVAPLVLGGLGDRAALGIPAEVFATLRTRVMTGAARCLRQAAEIGRLAEACRVAGVRVLALKGVALSQQLYGSPAMRQPGDIDLLVDPAQLWTADEVLTAHGYRRQGADPTQRLKAATLRWAKDLSYSGPGGHVELHQRLSENPALLPCDMDALWAARESVAVGGVRIDTLPRRFLALYLCVHGAGHFWERLGWLADLAALLAMPGAQSAALDDAEAAGLGPLMRQSVHLAHDWLAMPISDPRLLPDRAAKRRLEGFVRRFSLCWGGGLRTRYGGEWHRGMAILRRFERYRLRSDFRYRLHQLVGEMVTPFDWQAFPLPDRLFWLYLFLRPVGWLVRREGNFRKKGR